MQLRRFEDFYRQQRDQLVRALSASGVEIDLAVESVDEAMARALERWKELGGTVNPTGWVYRVARNLAVSRYRRLDRERRRPEVLPADRAVEQRWADPDLAAALESLGSDDREVLVMRFYLDWSIDDVADVLEIAPGTVKSRVHRALAKLKERLA